MNLVAYVDDSRQPRGGWMTLGGHVATVENWAALSEEWRQLLPKFATLNKNNLYEFKMSEMMQTPHRRANIQPFYRLIEKYALASISVAFRVRDHRRAMSRLMVPKARIQWIDLKNPYVFMFRAMMDLFHAHRELFQGMLFGTEQIDFVFDEQTESRMILAAWGQYMAKREEGVRNLFGQAPVFRSSEKYMPLQAADLWAGWIRRCEERGGNPNEMGFPNCETWEAAKVDARPAYHGRWNEDQLTDAFKELLREVTGPGVAIYDVRLRP